MKRKIFVKIGVVALCIMALVTFCTVGAFAQDNGNYYTEWDYYDIVHNESSACYALALLDQELTMPIGNVYDVYVIARIEGRFMNFNLTFYSDNYLISTNALQSSSVNTIDTIYETGVYLIKFEFDNNPLNKDFDYIKFSFSTYLGYSCNVTAYDIILVARQYTNAANNYALYRLSMYRYYGVDQGVYTTPEYNGSMSVGSYEKGYDDGYAEGEADGYDVGYDEGYEGGVMYGISSGYNLGKYAGYTEGKADGYDLGYEDGYAEGDLYGYDSGYSVGYNKGFSAGMSNEISLEDLPFSVVDSIANLFKGMLDFEILGVNVLALVVDIIALLLIIFVLKKIW